MQQQRAANRLTKNKTSNLMTEHTVRVQEGDFDIKALHNDLQMNEGAGAIVTFTGVVRGLTIEMDGVNVALKSMTLEYYPEMTERALQELVDQAAERWPLKAVTLIHRVGTLLLNEQIVFVGVASGHRAAAFEAATFLMDRLKTEAPFWKKETFENGKSRWVDFKCSDKKASSRW